jgi:hypothetical protein
LVIPHKRYTFIKNVHKTFLSLDIVGNESTENVFLPLQTLKLTNGTRRRKIDNSLNLQGINQDPMLGHKEAYKSPRNHTKDAFKWIQMDIIVATPDKSGL